MFPASAYGRRLKARVVPFGRTLLVPLPICSPRPAGADQAVSTPLDNTDFTPPSPRDYLYSRSEPSSRAPSTVPMGEGDDSDGDATISESSDDGGGVDGVFDVFQDNGSDEDELD